MASLTATTSKPGIYDRAAESLTWSMLVVIVGLVGLLYAEVLPDLASEWWTQPGSSYGILIPPIALYVAYLRRKITLSQPVQPSLAGLWLVGFACFALFLGSLAGEFFLARISFVLLLAGLTWALWGFDRLRTLAFPFILLATMVPWPALIYNAISAPLQLFASTVATALAEFLGVSIYRDGNIIHLANVSLGVAEACSGLQSLSAMVVASLLLGFLEEGGVMGRVLLLLLSIPLAIAINVLRVTGTAVLADYRTEFAMGFYHLFSGWLVFLVGFALLWLLAKLLFRHSGKVG